MNLKTKVYGISFEILLNNNGGIFVLPLLQIANTIKDFTIGTLNFSFSDVLFYYINCCSIVLRKYNHRISKSGSN